MEWIKQSVENEEICIFSPYFLSLVGKAITFITFFFPSLENTAAVASARRQTMSQLHRNLLCFCYLLRCLNTAFEITCSLLYYSSSCGCWSAGAPFMVSAPMVPRRLCVWECVIGYWRDSIRHLDVPLWVKHVIYQMRCSTLMASPP